ncbi:MAG: Asp23/Gls24 family envelope stress response protein [Candidatus Sumerlaeaceae bacterium]
MGVEEMSGAASPDEGDVYEADGGRIIVNDEVVAFIATIEMVKVDGVITLSGRSSYSDYDGAKSKDVEKGISVKINENRCSVAVEINIKYGANVYDTARKLQRAIKNAIESYTGLVVERVDVTIRGMINEGTLPPAKNKAA